MYVSEGPGSQGRRSEGHEVDASVRGALLGVIKSNVVDDLLRAPLEELRVFPSTELVEILLESWLLRSVRNIRGCTVLLGVVVIETEKAEMKG